MQHAHHLLLAARLLHLREHTVEEGDIIVGQVKMPRLLGQHRLILTEGVLQVVEMLELHGVHLRFQLHLNLLGTHQHLLHRGKVQFLVSNAQTLFRKEETNQS